MAPLPFTDVPLRALKSSYKKHIKGFQSEDKVRQLFLNRGFHLIGQRIRTPFSEVDFLFRQHGRYLMLEVKSADRFSYVSPRQMRALKLSFHYFLNKYNAPLRAHLALVEGSKINIIPDFLNNEA